MATCESEPVSVTRPRRRVWRRIVLAVAVTFVAVAAYPAWKSARTSYYLESGRDALWAGDMHVALTALSKAASSDPKKAETSFLMAIAFRRSGNFLEMERHLEIARALGWEPGDLRRQRLLRDVQRGDIGSARRYLEEKLAGGTATVDEANQIYEALAKGHLSNFRVSDAEGALYYWSKMRPDYPIPHVWLGDLWGRVEQPDSAEKEYRAALADDPQCHEARQKLAQLLLLRLETGEAQRLVDAGLAMTPDNVDLLVLAADLRRRQGRTEDGRLILERVLVLATTPYQRSHAQLELGRIALRDGRTEEAVSLLEQAVAADDINADAHFAYGQALAKSGRRDEAQVHFDRQRQLTDQMTKVGEIQQRLVTSPENADLRCEAGLILMEAGLKAEGAAWLNTALKYDPMHQESHAALAVYYQDLKQDELARRHEMMANRSAESPVPGGS